MFFSKREISFSKNKIIKVMIVDDIVYNVMGLKGLLQEIMKS